MKNIVLMSGGPDSLITLFYVHSYHGSEEIIPLHVSLGNKYEVQENHSLTYVEGLKEFRGKIDLSLLEEEDAHIFGRNAFLCLAAASEIEQGEDARVWLSVQKDEMSIPDRSDTFLRYMSDMLTVLVGGWVDVCTPWKNYDKTEMVEWFVRVGHDSEELLKTWSCYSPVEVREKAGKQVGPIQYIQCGDCPACVRRFIAFSLNGIEEGYFQDPKESKTAHGYMNQALHGNKYSAKRNRRIIQALG